ncbi:class I SAM-dependent methyltransferase [Prosthecobacter sp.]|uniref:class I SAM-dependent methyltransferase n=1 Tax=Prosthecobacter sp. TaxID=1965333 RepID=UPI003783432D
MKDIIGNRRRIAWTHKARLLRLLVKENGARWCLAFGIYYVHSALAQRAFNTMDRLRREKRLPGMNSSALNKAIWEAWDWSAGGEEWSPSEEWKASVIHCVLEKHVPCGSRVLEIGPGGGRWTVPLLARASEYVGIDISASCVELCRRQFAHELKARFAVGSGSDLQGVPDGSIDVLWSFDVFVHINQAEVEKYAAEFRRVLKPGGVGILHHGSVGGALGGWRSNVTHESMLKLLKERGFEIIASFKEWQDGGQTYQAGLYQDVITAFRQPLHA